MFSTLHREPTLSNKVASNVEAMILSGQLLPGDYLPAAPLLAEQFSVSRTVIREAIQVLVAKNLVEVRPGSGTIVRRPHTGSVAQAMRLLLTVGQPQLNHQQVIEVRRLVEIEVAGLAALRRTDDDLRALEANLATLPAALAEPERFAENDVAFHATLARATQNPLHSILLDSIADVMIAVRILSASVPGAPSNALVLHQAIFVQVQAGDSEKARSAMQEHLLEAEATMQAALGVEQRGST
jgi:GntR family transcriptional regulator, transcriptional repressor for pyruvate dehydrogenase complex